MIDNALEKFNQSIGYEKYLLEESLNVMSINTGEHFRFGIIFLNHEHETHCLENYEKLSNTYNSEFIKEALLPMIFISSYKIIDMFIEFILEYNKFKVPWRFKEKIEMVSNLINNLNLPKTINQMEFKAVYEIYCSLVENRNSMIHGRWGKVKNGTLVFNNGTNIDIEKIMAFANIAYLITKILNINNDELFYNSIKHTFKKNLNIISDLTKNETISFQETIVLYYEIKYKILDEDEEVNMVKIRRYINDDLNFWKRTDKVHKFEGIYNLYVISKKSKWKIPSNNIPKEAESINLKNFMNYICK
jgi:hypothetical protein